MTTIQLRRYAIEPGRMDDFVAWFPSITEPRSKFGFRVVFAYADDENDQFVWAVEHDGDFDAAEADYTGVTGASEGLREQPERGQEHGGEQGASRRSVTRRSQCENRGDTAVNRVQGGSDVAGRNGSHETRPDYDVVVVGAGFAGLYLLRRLRGARVLDSRPRVSRRRRRHVVLEPLSGRSVRHPDHRLHVQLRSRARARLDVVREVRHPARDPPLPAVRGRPVRPAPRHRLLDARRRGRVGRRGLALAVAHRHR